jgi:Hemerythrin HHE cation binding domain
MKRSEALAPLSRDHQHALEVALRLRRATGASAGDALARFGEFFAQEGARHFDAEERLVLPALPPDAAEWSRAVERVREDHEAIRSAAGLVGERGTPSEQVAAARALGERLHAHVRFEERVLFELLERRLPEAELRRLGAALDDADDP